jgi:hypothetical protein
MDFSLKELTELWKVSSEEMDVFYKKGESHRGS